MKHATSIVLLHTLLHGCGLLIATKNQTRISDNTQTDLFTQLLLLPIPSPIALNPFSHLSPTARKYSRTLTLTPDLCYFLPYKCREDAPPLFASNEKDISPPGIMLPEYSSDSFDLDDGLLRPKKTTNHTLCLYFPQAHSQLPPILYPEAHDRPPQQSSSHEDQSFQKPTDFSTTPTIETTQIPEVGGNPASRGNTERDLGFPVTSLGEALKDIDMHAHLQLAATQSLLEFTRPRENPIQFTTFTQAHPIVTPPSPCLEALTNTPPLGPPLSMKGFQPANIPSSQLMIYPLNQLGFQPSSQEETDQQSLLPHEQDTISSATEDHYMPVNGPDLQSSLLQTEQQTRPKIRARKGELRATRRSERLRQKQSDSAPQPTFRTKSCTEKIDFNIHLNSHHTPLDTSTVLQILQSSGMQITDQIEGMIEEAIGKDQQAQLNDLSMPTTPLHDVIPPLAVPGEELLL